MKAVKTIPSQVWMRSDAANTLFETLGEDNLLFVGGCVRNALLGADVDDIDLATKLLPEDVTAKLEEVGVKVVPTGIEHGTVTAVIDGKPFEITTLRKDVETDGWHATVSYTDDWAEDARRRDFTMNTLLADQSGNIYDPLGQGVSDLDARKVVFVGEAAERIEEDHLRILRYFRFHALYAEGEPDANALKACSQAADKIANLSRERVTQETFKILSVEDPSAILRLMFDNNILKEIFDTEKRFETIRHVSKFQSDYNLRFLASRILVLADFDQNKIDAFQKFILFPKVFLKDMKAIQNVLALSDLSDEHAVKVAIYKHGRVPTAQALMIELAQDRVMNAYAPKALDIVQNWDVPDFPLSGEDLMKEGFKPGPELGAELEKRENAWIDAGFKS